MSICGVLFAMDNNMFHCQLNFAQIASWAFFVEEILVNEYRHDPCYVP